MFKVIIFIYISCELYKFKHFCIISAALPNSIVQLEKWIKFSSKVTDINFQQTGVKCKAKISQYAKPYLNCIQISVIDLDDKWEVNFFNSVHTKRNNLFKCASKNKCWLQSPEINGVIVNSKCLDMLIFLCKRFFIFYCFRDQLWYLYWIMELLLVQRC